MRTKFIVLGIAGVVVLGLLALVFLTLPKETTPAEIALRQDLHKDYFVKDTIQAPNIEEEMREDKKAAEDLEIQRPQDLIRENEKNLNPEPEAGRENKEPAPKPKPKPKKKEVPVTKEPEPPKRQILTYPSETVTAGQNIVKVGTSALERGNVRLALQAVPDDNRIPFLQVWEYVKVDSALRGKIAERSEKQSKPLRLRYRGYAGIDYNFAVGRNGKDQAGFLTSHGCCIINDEADIFIGAGAGSLYHGEEKEWTFPIYCDIRYSVQQTKDAYIFIGKKLGYSLGRKQGYYYSVSIGGRILLNENTGMSISLGYTNQSLKSKSLQALSTRLEFDF